MIVCRQCRWFYKVRKVEACRHPKGDSRIRIHSCKRFEHRLQRIAIPAEENCCFGRWNINGYYLFTFRHQKFRAYCLSTRGKDGFSIGFSAVVKDMPYKGKLRGVVISDKEFYRVGMTTERMAAMTFPFSLGVKNCEVKVKNTEMNKQKMTLS